MVGCMVRTTSPSESTSPGLGLSSEMRRFSLSSVYRPRCDLFLCSQFPADKYSVSYNGRLEGVKVEPHIVDGWVRASELYHHPEMVKDGISKDDVNQGMLGKMLQHVTIS